MGSIAEKLDYLSQTKEEIRQAIVDKGVEVSDTDTFRSYAGKINEITGGVTCEAEGVEIELSGDFLTASKIYTIKVTDDKILITANASIGIWVYQISTKTLKNVYSDASTLSVFKQIGENIWAIHGDGTATLGVGLYIYNSDTDFCRQLSSSGKSFAVDLIADDVVLFASSTSIYSVNISTGEKNTVLGNTKGCDIFHKISDTEWLIPTKKTDTTQALYYFNAETNTKMAISGDNSNYLAYCQQVSPNKFLLSSNASNNKCGIMLYNNDTKTLSRLYDAETYNWNVFKQVTSNKWLIGGKNSSTVGMLLYNLDNDNIIQYGTDGLWVFMNVIDNQKCIVAKGYGTGAVDYFVLFNATDDSFTDIPYGKTAGANYCLKVSEGKYILSSSLESSNAGIFLFKTIDNSVAILNNALANFDTITKEADGRFAITRTADEGSSSPYKLIYDDTSEAIVKQFLKVEV